MAVDILNLNIRQIISGIKDVKRITIPLEIKLAFAPSLLVKI